MMKHVRTTALLAAIALAACAKADSPKADSAAMDGATTTIAPSTAGTPVDTAISANSGAGTAGATASGAMLDPNAATKEQLAAVPGMTPQAADALVAGRPYADMVAADKALAGAGLDSAARRQVYAQVFKPIDINKASKAEMLLIPGVGSRMSHEFEEYRPYKDLAQFDREIGKYVDKAEVARLRKYVRI
jgi:DNA uptake protein ComE-like DNA-binding protein